MDIRNRRALKQTAAQALSGASYDPRLLALIHAGVSLAAGLVIALVDYYLRYKVEYTGGLSGMGLRSAMGTIQTTLQYIVSILRPFWSIGFVFAALQMARQEPVGPKSLLEGFRKFGPVLRLRLTEGLLAMAAAIACAYGASFLFVMTPYSQPVMELFMPYMESASSMELLQEVILNMDLDLMMGMMTPYFVMFGVLFLVVGGFFFYRFRVADFVVMDGPRMPAMVALIASARMTRRRRWALLRLDLSFWWFYGLLALSAVVGYGDLLLPRLGVELPMSETAAWLLFYVLGILVQLAVYWWGYSYVQTTWAVCYDAMAEVPEQPKPQTVPQNLPWDYETQE